MVPHKDDSLDQLIARVNDLRAKANFDPNLRPHLEEIRVCLATALQSVERVPVFRVIATWNGALTLSTCGRSVPVDPAYVKHVLEKKGIDLALGASMAIDRATARDLIEEALAKLGQDQARLLSLRRELVHFFMLADESEERTKKCA